MNAINPTRIAGSLMLGIAVLAAPAAAQDPVVRAVELQQKMQRDARETQRRVDQLDEQTRKMLEQYRAAVWQAQQLNVYAAQLQKLVAEQEKELASLAEQLREVEVTEREILPLMLRMMDSLEKFVELDLPFLRAERDERLRNVRKTLTDPEAGIADRFRRLLEAYRVEADYGRTLGAERTEIDFDGQRRSVDVLHVGRLELFFLTLDGEQAGRWNPDAGRWEAIEHQHVAAVRQGLRIARETAAADLLVLPVRSGIAR